VKGDFRQQIYLAQSRKEREENKLSFGFFAPSLKKNSSATEFRPPRVLCGFA